MAMENVKRTSDSINSLMAEWKERQEKFEREEAERIAKEQAEWDALPEEEKQRILAEREQEILEQERKRAEEKKEKQILEWKKRGIPPRYLEATWDNWIADTPEKNEAKEKFKKAWNKNLFIVGGNGTGKTHLAMCLAKDGATYCPMPELFRSVRENMDNEQKIIDEYGECKLLILDEAGRQKGSDFERNLLFEIIDKRWNNMLPTTIIGNIDKQEFVNLYGSAIVDRLRPETIVLNWRSKR